MKFLALLVATCALSQTAIAQTGDCKSIKDSAPRLACYDRAAPPPASPVAAKPAQRATAMSKPDSGKYVDQISAEDALMNARLKNICKGC
jgi:hypothetical protein